MVKVQREFFRLIPVLQWDLASSKKRIALMTGCFVFDEEGEHVCVGIQCAQQT